MRKQACELAVGAGMVLVGLVLVVAFHDVETPVLGLRQTGFVIGALGVIELGVAGWGLFRSKN